ncbi:hypothetical protein A3G14_05490 [Candidatus Curtissbacteria bacterium RIFCSPLOWO2_12_FULL_38_9]|uniref:Uncharacterized protein n=1 Tax=Candidatus Curtissbacteria bacterium RIFCSPLOWO2_12_FULL_38_9 TaxID=1797735 RepID=A0A1F5IA87_9BACT|nr:MAG: hypothetical protein A3G14_05490 [Candidatus Curtissbacteria bacterium RIFCSPLOWO2_12_FULL_38_9]
MHKDIAKAEKIIKAANSAASIMVSGSSKEAVDKRIDLTLAIMQIITDKEGLSSVDGKSCANRKIPKAEKVAV